MSKSLSVKNLSGGYGEIQVLDAVSLEIKSRDITAIVGSNGAGKSTLMRLLSGLLVPQSGALYLDDRDITNLDAPQRLANGISLIPEGRLVFPQFTVAETLRIGAYTPHARPNWRHNTEKMYELFPRLYERRHTQAGFLSGGEQQMLAIARGLMAEPSILLLDEPSLGLAPTMVTELFSALLAINQSGMTVGLVEQNVQAALHLSNYTYVMEDGKIALCGESSKLLNSSEIQAAYLGTVVE